MLPPSWLCRLHLLGEHYELHKFRSHFEQKWKIAKRRGQIEPLAMRARHDELVEEILARGYRHSSPYRQPALAHLPDEDRYGKVNRKASIRDLMERCDACRERIEPVLQKRRERADKRAQQRARQRARRRCGAEASSTKHRLGNPIGSSEVAAAP